jgi:hypothetical protein
MDKGVFVVGMDRSGTSTATGLISLLGVCTPSGVDLIQARNENPKGVWESKSLVAFNRRVLATVGTDERFPIALEPGWEDDPRLERLRANAAGAVREVFPVSPWVWKDPLHCLVFAFWRKALAVQPVVVLMHRNPLEIAASAQRAWGREKIYGLALWERYLRQAVAQIEGLPVLVMSYDQILSEPLAWSEQVHGFLAGAGIRVDPPRERDVLSFVDPKLRHAHFALADVRRNDDVSGQQAALFEALVELGGSHEHFAAPELPDETPTTEALLAERRNAFQIKADLERLLDLERQSRWRARVRSSRYAAPLRRLYATARGR